MMKKPYTLTGLLLLSFALTVIWSARSYEYWSGNQPGPGFFPFWLGVVLAVLSIVLVIDSAVVGNGGRFEIPDSAGRKKLLFVLVPQIAILVLMPILGFRISAILYLFSLFSAFPRYKLVTNIIMSIGISLLFFAIFKTWLLVPLPEGILGI